VARRSRNNSRQDSGASGALLIDKPSGMTSHDVVDRIRKTLGTRKVGHAGTLDPDATGLLVLGVGPGTKLLQFVTGADKTYDGEIAFGVETSTLDAAGDVTATHDMEFSPLEAAAAAATFVGPIEQIPPMVSAVRIDGKRLHELARQGVEVDRPPRAVTINEFELFPTPDPLRYRFVVSCSSGTYIRTLAADLGHALGGGAHLASLRRTIVGAFELAGASPLDEPQLLPVATLLRGMPIIEVDETVAAQVRNGRSLGPAGGEGQIAVQGPDGRLLAVYAANDGEFRPVKVLVGNN